MRTRTLLAALLPIAALVACAAKTEKKPERICTPGAYVYCRCQDRQEGTKLCHDDGATFGPCEPCESATNPVDPTVPPNPIVDGGVDSPAPTKCGNRVPEQGEDCDDGNTDDTDGCDARCKLAGANPIATRSCPGLDAHVWADQNVVYDGTTTGSANSGSSARCPSSGGTPTTGANMPDRVFKVTAHATGTMIAATSNTSHDNYLWVTTDPCVPFDTPFLACSNEIDGIGGETIQFPVQAGKSYSVIVDGPGLSGNTGTFRITMKIQ